MTTLDIRDLHVSVTTDDSAKEILRGLDLTLTSGQTDAIMGPNGSGKSTLAYSIAGHPRYEVTSGSVTLDGADVLAMTVDERARAGLFLAMQYPVEVPGVSVSNFLRTAVTAVSGEAPKLRTWMKDMRQAMADLKVDRVRPAQRQRRLLRRGAQAARDSAVGAARRRSPSSTRPTRASTWTRSRSSPTASTGCAPRAPACC